MDKTNRSYNCELCNKYYSSYKILWNHNNKFHSIDVKNVKENVKSLTCDLCYKQFNTRAAKSIHKKKCNVIVTQLDKIKEETELTKLQLQLKKEEATILRLKLKLEKSDKIDNFTVRQLNKRLIQRNNLIKNSTVNSHNTQNNIVNNFNLIGFGKEDIIEKLTNREKKLIMNAKYSSLEKLINIVHCGNYNQFKNIIITNMKDNYMYKYDDKVGHFVLSTKADVLNSLIGYRLDDLEVIYNDLIEQNKLDENTKDIIEKFINKINYDNSKYIDYDGKEHDNYKEYKINEIKILLYNNQDKITNDISLLLTTSEELGEYYLKT
jgi:hypothetical protein